jgi:hypothetical protein
VGNNKGGSKMAAPADHAETVGLLAGGGGGGQRHLFPAPENRKKTTKDKAAILQKLKIKYFSDDFMHGMQFENTITIY